MEEQERTVTGRVISASSLVIKVRDDRSVMWSLNWSSDRGRPPARATRITVTFKGLTALRWEEA